MIRFSTPLFRSFFRSRVALHVLSAACGVLIACGINMYTDRDDVTLGANLDKEIRANRKEYPILVGHPEVKAYVTAVVQKVLGSPDVQKRAIYPYVVEIIHDDKTINAFCTPGGYIYVYTGLLKFLDNEASLAGVLGHEIAHAERRHATKRITAAYGVQVLLGATLGKNPGKTEEIAANLFTNLGFMKNSRDDEMEADNFSMLYLRGSEYYPGSIKYFFDKIGTSGKGSSNALAQLFLTHPPSDARANNVNAKMNEWKLGAPAESQIFIAPYQAFKKKLP